MNHRSASGPLLAVLYCLVSQATVLVLAEQWCSCAARETVQMHAGPAREARQLRWSPRMNLPPLMQQQFHHADAIRLLEFPVQSWWQFLRVQPPIHAVSSKYFSLLANKAPPLG